MIFEVPLDHFPMNRQMHASTEQLKATVQKKTKEGFKAISAIRGPMMLAMQTLKIEEPQVESPCAPASSQRTSISRGSVCSDTSAAELKRYNSAPQLNVRFAKKLAARREQQLQNNKSGSLGVINLPQTLLNRFKHLTNN